MTRSRRKPTTQGRGHERWEQERLVAAATGPMEAGGTPIGDAGAFETAIEALDRPTTGLEQERVIGRQRQRRTNGSRRVRATQLRPRAYKTHRHEDVDCPCPAGQPDFTWGASKMLRRGLHLSPAGSDGFGHLDAGCSSSRRAEPNDELIRLLAQSVGTTRSTSTFPHTGTAVFRPARRLVR